jgi:hypothetical protein
MLTKYLKVKITAADTNLAIKWHVSGQGIFFPQYWKQTADIKGDQAKEVRAAKSRKGLEFLYHKDKGEEDEQGKDKCKKISKCVEESSLIS